MWCPDCRGFIATDDGAKILFTVQGYSLDETTSSVRRAIAAAVWFRAQDERYRWLTTTDASAKGKSTRRLTWGGSTFVRS